MTRSHIPNRRSAASPGEMDDSPPRGRDARGTDPFYDRNEDGRDEAAYDKRVAALSGTASGRTAPLVGPLSAGPISLAAVAALPPEFASDFGPMRGGPFSPRHVSTADTRPTTEDMLSIVVYRGRAAVERDAGA